MLTTSILYSGTTPHSLWLLLTIFRKRGVHMLLLYFSSLYTEHPKYSQEKIYLLSKKNVNITTLSSISLDTLRIIVVVFRKGNHKVSLRITFEFLTKFHL